MTFLDLPCFFCNQPRPSITHNCLHPTCLDVPGAFGTIHGDPTGWVVNGDAYPSTPNRIRRLIHDYNVPSHTVACASYQDISPQVGQYFDNQMRQDILQRLKHRPGYDEEKARKGKEWVDRVRREDPENPKRRGKIIGHQQFDFAVDWKAGWSKEWRSMLKTEKHPMKPPVDYGTVMSSYERYLDDREMDEVEDMLYEWDFESAFAEFAPMSRVEEQVAISLAFE